MVFKFLSLLSFALIFAGLSLVSVSALDAHGRTLIAETLFKTHPFHWSLLE